MNRCMPCPPARALVWTLAALTATAALLSGLPACQAPHAPLAAKPLFPFQDSTLTMEERADDLVARMTLPEKVGQMQMDAPAIERLHVPAYHWWNEGLHGVARNGVATVFPQAIGMAATFNPDLHYRVAQTIAVEARAKHEEALRHDRRGINTGLDLWSPNINIFRDPRWGRGQETYGEDPYLTGRMAVAFVKGLQGDDEVYFQTIATPKHFAVHSGPETDRHRFNAVVSTRDLWETYLPAFEAAVREGRAYSIMGAYNRLGDVPCCANPRLLGEILRQQWGFAGYVVSDVGAIDDIYAGHQYTDTGEEAAALAVKAGCDLNGGSSADLLGAVRMGMISTQQIDVSVRRLLLARLRLGMFDMEAKGPNAPTPYAMNDRREHENLAREVARQSMVLLQNRDGALPLKKDLPTIAVIGPTADNVAALLGNYNGTPARPVTILQGIRNAVSPSTRVLYAQGSPLVAELLPMEEVVPPGSLFTDASCRTAGLRADYFSNMALAGKPFKTRVDGTLDFDWSVQSPRDLLPTADAFSARWTGVLVPPESGVYQLGLAGKDGYRLFVDGRRVVDDWSTGPRRSIASKLTLEKGKAYAVCVEYFHAKDEATVQLRWTRPGGEPFYAGAVRAAKNADAVVMVLGLTAGLEREQDTSAYEGFAGGDRQTLDLPSVQEELLEAVAATGKPVTLVLTSGSALSVNWAAQHVGGIVQAWYPGEQGGNAVADVLFGQYSPSGRLPVTFYKSINDLPAFEDYSMQGRTYRFFAGQPLWEFGYGLSYATFSYGEVEVLTPRPSTTEDLVVRVKIRNTGKVASDEVPQLYVNRDGAPGQPRRRSLQGFARVRLAPGEERTVEFTLTPYQLAVVAENGERWLDAGQVQIQISGSSQGGVAKTVPLTGTRARPDYRYVPPRLIATP